MGTDLPTGLASKADAISKALEEAVPLQEPLPIYQAMRYSLLPPAPSPSSSASTVSSSSEDASRHTTPGKRRLHGLLCLCSCELFQVSPHLAMPAACALEMLHAASLIHDDLPCMDNDDLRGDLPTNHKVYGEAMAVLAGDALYALAVEHVTKNTAIQACGARVLHVVAELSRAVGSEGMVAGQFLDLTSSRSSEESGAGRALEEDTAEDELPSQWHDLQKIHIRKVASLTGCSAVCGAILGGATEAEIEKLREFGSSVGILCSVVDDVLKASQNCMNGEKTGNADLPSNLSLLGIERCIALVEELRCRSRQCLQGFDKTKAESLHCLVDFLVNQVKFRGLLQTP